MVTMTRFEAEQYIRVNAENLRYEDNECFAIRSDNFIPKRNFRKSLNRPDGVPSGKTSGVCACFVAENDAFGDYEEASIPQKFIGLYGAHTFLLKGKRIEWGNDEWNNEVILRDHEIICMII